MHLKMGHCLCMCIDHPGKAHCNADALSRLPLPDCPESTPVPAEVVLMLGKIDSTPITVSQIRTCTCSDSLLSKVYHYVSLVGQQVFQLNYNLKEMNCPRLINICCGKPNGYSTLREKATVGGTT